MNIVISGASKGIGKAIALKFINEGHNVAICSRNEISLETFRSESDRLGVPSKVITVKADISIRSEVIAFAQECITHFGVIDVLINNAGVFFPGKITEEEDGKLEKLIETNLYSAYHLTRAIFPHMKNSGKPHIFNICSIASITAYPNGGSYSISKFALLGFSKVLREELKEKGIKVTAVLPGATWSDSWAGVDLPFERLMEANDIADLVWNTYQLGPSAVVEEIIIRPLEGDL
jgi:short-subunit dehydrogenase